MPNADPNKDRKAWLQERIIELAHAANRAPSAKQEKAKMRKLGNLNHELETYGMTFNGLMGLSNPNEPNFVPTTLQTEGLSADALHLHPIGPRTHEAGG